LQSISRALTPKQASAASSVNIKVPAANALQSAHCRIIPPTASDGSGNTQATHAPAASVPVPRVNVMNKAHLHGFRVPAKGFGRFGPVMGGLTTALPIATVP